MIHLILQVFRKLFPFWYIIPLNVEAGQIAWSVMGQGVNKSLTGYSEQVSEAEGIASTYNCANCCPDSYWDSWLTPSDTTGFIGDTVQFSFYLQTINCYNVFQTPFYIYGSNVDWSSNDPSVATCDNNGLATGIGVGQTGILGFYPATTYFEGEGNCEEMTAFANPFAFCQIAPKVEILRNGQVISGSNASTQNVVVGEKIELSTQVSGGTPNNPQWTISGNSDEKVKNYNVICNGTNIGGKTACTSPTSADKVNLSTGDLQQTSLQFFWVNGANNREITFTTTINGQTHSATANFNVTQPSVTNLDLNNSIVNIGIEFNTSVLRYGAGNAPAPAGVEFEATVNNNQITGTYQWVQIYNESKSIKLTSALGNCAAGKTMIQSGSGLDVTYPYNPGLTMEDRPKIELTDNLDLVTVDDSATAWLMFKPTLTNSIWIPLKKVDWSWAGNAQKVSSNNWNLVSKSNPQPTGQTTTSFPEWSRNVSSNSLQCQN